MLRKISSIVKRNNKNDGVDQFLRPVNWVASLVHNSKANEQLLILLSPFEVNELLPKFRRGVTKAILHMFAPTLYPEQESLLMCKDLILPLRNLSLRVPQLNLLNAELMFFSGSYYFGNKEEQDFYCDCLGFVPHPRSDKEQEAFEKEYVEHNGFVIPCYRKDVSDKIARYCGFKQNPEKLLVGIIERRHELLPKMSHTAQVIYQRTKPLK